MWMVGPRFLTVGLIIEEQGGEDQNNPCGNGSELQTSYELLFTLIWLQMDSFRTICRYV